MFKQHSIVTTLSIFTIIFFSWPRCEYAGNAYDIPFIYELLPGGTHFYTGDTFEGAAFLSLEMLLSAGAIASNSRLNRSEVKEWNVPLILAGQVYSVDKWRYFQKISLRTNKSGSKNGVRFDPSPLPHLFRAPFDPGNIMSPLVITFTLLGIADGIIGYTHHDQRCRDISTVNALGYRLNREEGTLYYETASAALSYGAAFSEEMLFRGMLLPKLDYSFGKRTGLVTSSLIFGLLHLTNSGIDRPLYFVSQATLAGFMLGWSVQRGDYHLGNAIAAHFWYDFASLTTTWLMNPRENPLGISVGFTF
jgi:membrane protease YdiL (CAAX protease family)